MISVFEPQIGDEEIVAVAAAMRRGEISGSFGLAVPEFEDKFAAYCGVRYGVATSSGTTALHLAVAAAGIGPGDEVLVSACTNIATALAVYHNGAVAVAVDSERETWNLDLELIERLLTEKTRAIIPVHIYGHPVDMDRLMEIADRHGLLVIEDCAESHGATVRGRMTGSFGQMACFSFYANKVITTGEGGMVLTNNDRLVRELRSLRNLAFGTPRFLHDSAGFNFRMTGMQAAMGTVQLSRIEAIVAAKRRVAARYDAGLAALAHIRRPTEASWARNVYWMYAVAVEEPFERDRLTAFLLARGIETRTFFCPMNRQPFLRRQAGFRDVPCPVAERLWSSGFYLPSSASLTDEQIDSICDAVRRYFDG